MDKQPMLSQWQPIKTAPKDGTEIFLHVSSESLYPIAGHYSSRAYFKKEYDDPDYMEEGWYFGYGYPTDMPERTINPTHWMPIPQPPIKQN